MPSQQTYHQLISLIRNLDRRESVYVIWAYTQILQFPDFRMPNDIEVARAFQDAEPRQTIVSEWSLEILAREVLKHAGEVARRGLTLRNWATLAEAMNLLRELEGELYNEFNQPEQIHLELMRITHQQFAWQRDQWNEQFLLRYYKIFGAPALNDMCLQQTGLTVQKLLLIGTFYIGHFAEDFFCSRALNIEVPDLTQADIDRFLALASCRQTQLARLLRAEHNLDEQFKYRYSSVRQYPVVQISFNGQDQLVCPQPTLLFWRFTQGLYYEIQGIRGFPLAFGSSFQSYIGEVLEARVANEQLALVAETAYHVGRNRKDTVDWIVCEGDDAALFVECKTKRLTWNSKAGLTDLAALAQDIRKLAGAVFQLYKTVLDYEVGNYPNLPFEPRREIFPVVVTLEDWLLFGHDLPARLFDATRTLLVTNGYSDEIISRLPVTIMSAEEFETTAGLINSMGIRAVMNDKVRGEEFRRWAMGPYLMARFPEQRRALPPLFQGEFADAFPGIPDI